MSLSGTKDCTKLARRGLVVMMLAASMVGCAEDAEEAEASEDPLTARGDGVGSLLTIEGSCKKRSVGTSEFGADTPGSVKLKVIQGAGQVLARFPTRDFGDVDVPLSATGTGSKKTTVFGDPIPVPGSYPFNPKYTLKIDVRLADGSIEVGTVRTDEGRVGSAVTECSYDAPTTLWLDPTDSPPTAPELRFPEGKLKSSGWCMVMKQGRLRVAPCTEAPRWAITKDNQLWSEGKCARLGDIAGGSKYPHLGDCPGQRIHFHVTKISTGRQCLPTRADNAVFVNPVRGTHTVDCTSVAGGLGAWEFREDGTLLTSKNSSQCLVRNGKVAKIGTCSSKSRWEVLPQGRLRHAGTSDCVYANSSGALVMGNCNEALPPWRIKGAFSTTVNNGARYLSRTPSGVVDLAYSDASAEWELNF